MKSKIEELRDSLKKIAENEDTEERHLYMDKILLEFIGDKEVSDIFYNTYKWYA